MYEFVPIISYLLKSIAYGAGRMRKQASHLNKKKHRSKACRCSIRMINKLPLKPYKILRTTQPSGTKLCLAKRVKFIKKRLRCMLSKTKSRPGVKAHNLCLCSRPSSVTDVTSLSRYAPLTKLFTKSYFSFCQLSVNITFTRKNFKHGNVLIGFR